MLLPPSVIVGLALPVDVARLAPGDVNRHIRGRLLLSASLFAVYTLAAIALHWLSLPDDTRQDRCRRSTRCWSLSPSSTSSSRCRSIRGGSTAFPNAFPNIVQDTLVIALFALVATLILRDRVMATTAVGAVVIGLALQDTLGNLFAGLAIQIEKPFRVGDWVTIGGQDGIVSEITWRATKMRTKAGNFVVVPNSVLAKDTITNYCQPTRSLRLHVDVGASYDVPPNVVKAVIREALQNAPEILTRRAVPKCCWPTSAIRRIMYRVRFWVSDFEADERAKDLVRSLIYYAFKRNNITIPYPIQVEMSAEEGGVVPVRSAVGADALASVCAVLVALARRAHGAAGRREAGQYAARRSDCSSGPARQVAFRRHSRRSVGDACRHRGRSCPACAAAMCSARCRC